MRMGHCVSKKYEKSSSVSFLEIAGTSISLLEGDAMQQRFQQCLLASFLWFQCFTLQAESVAQKVGLRERVYPGRVMRTASALTAEGMFLLDPAADPTQNLKPEEVKPESLKVQVQARLIVQDRW